jgi:PAS domain S-box-containing protein
LVRFCEGKRGGMAKCSRAAGRSEQRGRHGGCNGFAAAYVQTIAPTADFVDSTRLKRVHSQIHREIAAGAGGAKGGGVSEANSMPDAEDTKLAGLQKERQGLAEQVDAQANELSLLRARFAHYEDALRGSHVTVCTQDRDLRYTSASDPMFGHSREDIVGRTDEELLAGENGAGLIALKREALSTGRPKRGEFSFTGGPGTRWYDVHIEPMRNAAGDVAGLTCASVDVTERKVGEVHLRLLLRELTHRSKNLLAVIQAMARQTARHAGSTEGFLSQFGARLQALASSHDILVRESWHGASIGELVRSQLSTHVGHSDGQIALEGPDIALKPEAAQNLGLALHELASNAKKFGALSVPDGRVSVSWGRDGGDASVELIWLEQFGPKVKARRKRGFGSLVIERNLARSLDARVDLEFEPDGVRCRIVIPASQALATR